MITENFGIKCNETIDADVDYTDVFRIRQRTKTKL